MQMLPADRTQGAKATSLPIWPILLTKTFVRSRELLNPRRDPEVNGPGQLKAEPE